MNSTIPVDANDSNKAAEKPAVILVHGAFSNGQVRSAHWTEPTHGSCPRHGRSGSIFVRGSRVKEKDNATPADFSPR